MKAVVFDFFGTLTDPVAEAGRRASFTATAYALGVAPDDFWTVMSGRFHERSTGVHGDTRSTLRAMARLCGADPAPDRLDAATGIHRAGAAAMRPPRPGVPAALAELRARGMRLGVLSDCSSELCEAWPGTPYAPLVDAAVFSWQEGHRKPDPRLYATVAARLGVAAPECWYVGDGGSRELQGAAAAGMRPVLVRNDGVPDLRTDPDPYVPALVVADTADVLQLIS